MIYLLIYLFIYLNFISCFHRKIKEKENCMHNQTRTKILSDIAFTDTLFTAHYFLIFLFDLFDPAQNGTLFFVWLAWLASSPPSQRASRSPKFAVSFIDYSRIPANNGAESRPGRTKIQQMYENVHSNLARDLLFQRTQVECGKGL